MSQQRVVVRNRGGVLGVYVITERGQEIQVPGVQSICIDPIYADSDVKIPTARISLAVDLDMEVRSVSEIPIPEPTVAAPILGDWIENVDGSTPLQPPNTRVEVWLRREGRPTGNTRRNVHEYRWVIVPQTQSDIIRYRFMPLAASTSSQ